MNYNNEIRKHRTTTVTLTVLQDDNTPLANQEVVIAQTKHQFLFGCNGFELIPFVNNELQESELDKAHQYNELFLNLFNFVTLPFYWGPFEPKQGQPQTERIKTTAKWCQEQNLLVKGHPLSWHTLAPEWLLPMSTQEIIDAQIKRIKREVTDFQGLIDIWDVINEVVIMPIFNKYDNGLTRICNQLGRINTIKMVFEAAREANPRATLLLNDFDLSPAYDILIEGCLEAGIKIDTIGIQSHMHQGYWGVEKTLRILERFERFNLPIHFTETTIISGQLMPPEYDDLNDYQVTEWPTTPDGEERQLEEVLLHYKTLFSRPLVQGITWWDFSDDQWLHAPCGLIRKDGSPKPAYQELLKLVKGEWWLPPTKFVTDQEGRIKLDGFFSDYKLSYSGKESTFSLEAENSQPVIKLK
ncbi:MAG TPA: endo-1,4-beta-xylanase [Bacillota bacterium]|nr:endo-1,4-beta-xylanase [Bacillota bacterium]HOL10235.1 endo-1,4-beta-xylanase [Bacillota bacterium]HPO98005.1 endo-1,4-beta-xylanase [Bacillota bacterium]